jgi:hypothetical protein
MSMEARHYRLTEKFQKGQEEHEKAMSDTLRAAGENHKKLEDELHRSTNMLKEAEERARDEEAKRAQAEAEMAKIKEKMKELEAECVSRLGHSYEEGMGEGLIKGEELGLKKGRELGKEEAMEEVKTHLQKVYNSGFRHGWKSALIKTEQPEVSELFLRANTPLPYLDAGLKNSDDEEDEGEEEEEEEAEKEGREGKGRKEEEKEKEREGRKEEEKEKGKGEMEQERDQRQGDGQTEPTTGLLDVVDLTEQTSATPEQPSSS